MPVLHPSLLREAAWHGSSPDAIPLAVLVARSGAPTRVVLAWGLRRRSAPRPLGTLVLGLGCALLATTGLAVAAGAQSAGSAQEFKRFHLACERV